MDTSRPKVSFHHTLGVRVTRKHKDGVTVECLLHAGLLNGKGVAHGGVIAAIVDEAAWYAIEHRVGRARDATTTELKVNYLRPLAGKKATARAILLRARKTLCVARVDLKDAHRRLAAVAIVAYMLLGPRSPRRVPYNSEDAV
ncbi:MAG: PaaI family thioesterase [Pseudomonadota bacterium]